MSPEKDDKHIYRRHGHYWIKYRHQGQERRESVARVLGIPVGTATRQHAKDAYDKRMREMYTGRYVEPSHKNLTVGDCLDALVTNLKLRRVRSLYVLSLLAERLKKDLGAIRASEMSTARLERIAEGQMEGGKAPATVRGDLRLLVQALRLAVDHHRLAEAPRLPRIAVDNARRGFVTPEQFGPLLAAMREPVIRDITEWAWLTAWRKMETLLLTWDRVDRGAREVRLVETKNGERRVLPLEGRLGELIEARWKERAIGVPYVFHADGQRVGEWRLRAHFTKAARAVNLSHLIFHDLRRSAIRNMVRAGLSQPVAMRISGHKTATVFSRYDITSTDDLAQGLRRVQGYLADNSMDTSRTGSENA